jgi:hypothetical protein
MSIGRKIADELRKHGINPSGSFTVTKVVGATAVRNYIKGIYEASKSTKRANIRFNGTPEL